MDTMDSSSSPSSTPPLTDLALASLSLADVVDKYNSIHIINDSVYSSKGVRQTSRNNTRDSSNLLFTCNSNALVGVLGSRPLAASCLSRTLSNRSTSSNASSVNSNRSVRFTEDKPQVRYTYPKHVYDRAPIRVDERLALKRCRNEEEPRKWVEYLIDDFNGTDALSKYDDYDWSISGEDKVVYPSVSQLSQLPPLPPSPTEVVKSTTSNSQIKPLDIFKVPSSMTSGSDSDSDGSSDGCDVYRRVLCDDESPSSTPATSPASSPMSNVLPSGSFAFNDSSKDENETCPSLLATPTRRQPEGSDNIAALPLFSPSSSSPSRSIPVPSASSPNFARWDAMCSSSLPTSLCTPLTSSALSSSSVRELQGACPGGIDEKRRLRLERLKLLRERCSVQEDSFGCLGGF